MILHPVILLVFLLQLVHRTAYRIPINEAESNAPREDDALAQQDVRRNEGEKRNKRNCNVVPFDVQCHGRCPYTENEWNSMRSSWNCSNERVGATYHCTDPDDESGNPIEACVVPKYCDKGKRPVISFPQGHLKTAYINCTWCPEEYFNPHESIWSANVSKCPEPRKKCGHRDQIECDIVTGVKRHWTNSKCECDIKNNYFPLDSENQCTDQSLYCFGYLPCKKSPEGFDQIYIFSVSEGKVF
ncbi:uncharacterized protein LOC132740234 [Ruditapes philippinarum]|uniref:uncharacterized protein LOC132740234 n=1 Tax=Ruditapes philippinarum TaxID=129788 RepID=UPI00295B9ED4|nr:uncharacterized protein LOC132740234 [Ruditapes philippinarum]